MMCLSTYDILKRIRQGVKINRNLTRVVPDNIHASDETTKQYSVVDHRNKETKNMVFKLNPDMGARQLTVAEKVNFAE